MQDRIFSQHSLEPNRIFMSLARVCTTGHVAMRAENWSKESMTQLNMVGILEMAQSIEIMGKKKNLRFGQPSLSRTLSGRSRRLARLHYGSYNHARTEAPTIRKP